VRVQLIGWNAAEAAAHADALTRAGFDVTSEPFEPFPAALRRTKANPPDVYLIDLSRLPSVGRDVAFALREAKVTRFVPIVLCGGDEAKLERIRQQVPDATYTTWPRVKTALRKARPPKDPFVPATRLDGYSGTPLPKKLGIKPGMDVALVNAPDGFDVHVSEAHVVTRGRADLAIWFVTSQSALLKRIDAVAARAGGNVWIAWPKKASGVRSDVTETVVRKAGLERGLVDYKIAAIDATWSGLRFTKKK